MNKETQKMEARKRLNLSKLNSKNEFEIMELETPLFIKKDARKRRLNIARSAKMEFCQAWLTLKLGISRDVVISYRFLKINLTIVLLTFSHFFSNSK